MEAALNLYRYAGVNHPAILQRKHKFDYCIIDEAGQSLMTSALGPLFHADKFVLVGDPNQLPPVVTSGAAKARGLDTSLFSHLAVKGQNVIPLTMQYRMNSAIQVRRAELKASRSLSNWEFVICYRHWPTT